MVLAALGFLVLSGLPEVPCTFVRRWPVVTLTSKSASYRLLLDSGCTESTLFSDKARLDSPARKVDMKGFGSISFLDRPISALGPDLAKMLREAKVEGLLGADFFKQRDVLVDYKQRRVFFSSGLAKGAPALPSKTFESVSLIEVAQGFGTTVVHSKEPLGVAVMVVDTGAGATCLPVSSAPHARPPDSKGTTMITVGGTHEGWIEAGSLTLAGISKPFSLDIWYVGDAPAILSPMDLGAQVFFSFRNSEMYVNRVN